VDLLAPWTGFGDETNTSIKFGILAPDGRVPNWSGGPKLTQLDIPHSDSQIIQNGGRRPWVVTFRCYFDTIEDMEMMDALQGTRQTLRYLAGVTKKAGGYIETAPHGVSYLVLPDTLLVSMSDETYEVEGSCEATLTFSRAGASTAYYGFSVYAEDL
jgi:hypothetical protein